MSKLAIETVSLDYPLGPSKAWANKVMISYFATVLKDPCSFLGNTLFPTYRTSQCARKPYPCSAEDLKGLETESICAWALHTVGSVLDKAGLWLEDRERKLFVESRSGRLAGIGGH